MKPAIEDGQLIVARRGLPRAGQVVLALQGDREVVKRVDHIKGARYYLLGDNSEASSDSRDYGFVHKKDILGTIMVVLPRATKPPKLVKPYGLWLGRVAALISMGMALVHLFRIDTFIPILDAALPGGIVVAIFVAKLVILSEIFAIPFALRMKLSPLAHLVSGALLVFAPLWWVAIDVMTVGLARNTGQLGEFVAVPSEPYVLALNALWVIFAYVTLYTLGYDNLKPRSTLKNKPS